MTTSSHKTAYLFVCYGNTCRSPMAEAFARNLLPVERFNVQSAGIGAQAGMSASTHSVNLMQKHYGIDITGHRSQNVADLPLEEFTQIILLDEPVGLFMQRNYPHLADKLIAWNIADPYGTTEESYRTCAATIHEQVTEWVKALPNKW